MAKKGLGRGLNSLLTDNAIDEVSPNGITVIKISDIEPNRGQARKQFDETALLELADSIGRHGILQPIAVRQKDNGFYEIIAGERRWRASKIAGLREIPAIVKEADDMIASELSLIENLQRENLNAVEEALGYKDLMDSFGLTQEEAAEKVGKSRTAVANLLRILKLPESVLALVRDSSLSYGHARALVPLIQYFDEKQLETHAKHIVSNGLSVRQTEQFVKQLIQKPDIPDQTDESPVSKAYYKKIESDISDILGRRASIKRSPDGKGKLSLAFSSSEDLEALIRNICGNNFFDNQE